MLGFVILFDLIGAERACAFLTLGWAGVCPPSCLLQYGSVCFNPSALVCLGQRRQNSEWSEIMISCAILRMQERCAEPPSFAYSRLCSEPADACISLKLSQKWPGSVEILALGVQGFLCHFSWRLHLQLSSLWLLSLSCCWLIVSSHIETVA